MQDDDKGQRGARRRERAAAATQAEIVEAARRLFVERGYVGTTIEAIAEAAGVAVQTIYNSVGAKRDLLSRVLDYSAAGAQAPVSVPEFMRARTANAADASEIVALLADWFVEVHGRTAPIMRVIQDAAAVDTEVATLEARRARQRFENYREPVHEIARRGGPDHGAAVDDGAAVIWTLGHPTVYRFLVLEQGWPIERYRAWVERGLYAQLLGAGGGGADALTP